MATKPIPNTTAVPADAIERYREASEAIKEWEDVKKAARAQIEKALGDNEVGTVRGRTVVTFKHMKVTRLDQALLKKMHPEVAAECTTMSEQRRMELI